MELFGTALVDGAGAKVRENSDKKKLQEAEGDPEKINQILADIEKRKRNGNRLILYLIVFMFVFLCFLLLFGFFHGDDDGVMTMVVMMM